MQASAARLGVSNGRLRLARSSLSVLACATHSPASASTSRSGLLRSGALLALSTSPAAPGLRQPQQQRPLSPASTTAARSRQRSMATVASAGGAKTVLVPIGNGTEEMEVSRGAGGGGMRMLCSFACVLDLGAAPPARVHIPSAPSLSMLRIARRSSLLMCCAARVRR